MRKVILLSVILVSLITGMGFASQGEIIFQNEPDGFRGLKWGDTPTEDMRFFSQDSFFGNWYYREDDKLNIGNAKLRRIYYRFNLYSNQFYDIFITFVGEDNYDILKIIFEGKYGKPTQEDKDSLYWIGDKARILLSFKFKEGKGSLSMASMEIRKEKPEDNKQKELEKAKDDF